MAKMFNVTLDTSGTWSRLCTALVALHESGMGRPGAHLGAMIFAAAARGKQDTRTPWHHHLPCQSRVNLRDRMSCAMREDMISTNSTANDETCVPNS